MHLTLTKRIEVPENWFAAFLFPFKLFTVGAAIGLLVWYVSLPPDRTSAKTGIDMAWTLALDDYYLVASTVSLLYLLAACVLVIGGLIQLFKYSRRAALWSIAFGVFAFIIGIVLMECVSPPHGHEILQSVV